MVTWTCLQESSNWQVRRVSFIRRIYITIVILRSLYVLSFWISNLTVCLSMRSIISDFGTWELSMGFKWLPTIPMPKYLFMVSLYSQARTNLPCYQKGSSFMTQTRKMVLITSSRMVMRSTQSWWSSINIIWILSLSHLKISVYITRKMANCWKSFKTFKIQRQCLLYQHSAQITDKGSSMLEMH